MPAEHLPQAETQILEESINPAFSAFRECLGEHALGVNEIAEKQEAITQAGNELIEQYDIKPSLFEDRGRSFVFTAIAERKAAQIPEDSDFIANTLALLAYKHSDKLAPAEQIINPNGSFIDQAHEDAIYNRYTHKQLSAELSEAIRHGGMLDDVKSRMGITPENEQPFEVRVLTIEDGGANNFGLDSAGIFSPITPWEEVQGETIHEKTRNNQIELDIRQDLEKHKKDLLKRGQQMASELGHPIARAWVSTAADGQRVLYVSMPLAEKLLDPSLVENSNFSEADWQKDFAVLEHEYVHTQGGLNIDHDVHFGISVEERRAEYFSRDKNGYQDVKGLMLDVAVASNMLVTNIFDKRPAGGRQVEVFTDIANQLGVRNTLELLIVPPQAYVNREQGNELQRAVVDHIGGFDGVVSRILERSIEQGDKSAIEQRVIDRAKIIKKQGDYAGWVLNYRRGFGLNTMTNLYESAMAELSS